MTTRRIIEIDLTNSDDELPRITIRNIPILGDITSSTQNRQNIPLTTRPPRRRRRRNEDMEANKENQPPATGSGLQKNEMESYCVKCKRKEPMLEPKEITTSNGRKAMSGKCAVCGTKMIRFIKK
jgi:hypothetical protein